MVVRKCPVCERITEHETLIFGRIRCSTCRHVHRDTEKGRQESELRKRLKKGEGDDDGGSDR